MVKFFHKREMRPRDFWGDVTTTIKKKVFGETGGKGGEWLGTFLGGDLTLFKRRENWSPSRKKLGSKKRSRWGGPISLRGVDSEQTKSFYLSSERGKE